MIYRNKSNNERGNAIEITFDTRKAFPKAATNKASCNSLNQKAQNMHHGDQKLKTMLNKKINKITV